MEMERRAEQFTVSNRLMESMRKPDECTSSEDVTEQKGTQEVRPMRMEAKKG